MSRQHPDIGFVFYQNSFSKEEIEEMKQECERKGITFDFQERTCTTWACLDVLAPLFQIILSPEVVNSVLNQLFKSATYDFLKYSVISIWRKVRSKKALKVTSQGAEPISSSINIRVENIEGVFPATTDEEIVNHFIDKLFDYLKTTHSSSHQYALYDVKKIA